MNKWTINQANVGLDVAYKPITILLGDSGRAIRVSDESDDTDMAHARLIAAAPEMYALIEQLAHSGTDSPLCNSARAILAKVEGQ